MQKSHLGLCSEIAKNVGEGERGVETGRLQEFTIHIMTRDFF